MRAVRVNEVLHRGGDPFDTMGVGRIQILRDFIKNPKLTNGKVPEARYLGFKLDQDSPVVDHESALIGNWAKYPQEVKDALRTLIPDQLPNYTKTDEELMVQIEEATKILEDYGFEVEPPSKILPTRATIKAFRDWKVPNDVQSRNFAIYKPGFVRFQNAKLTVSWEDEGRWSNIGQWPMDTYQELAQRLIDYVERTEAKKGGKTKKLSDISKEVVADTKMFMSKMKNIQDANNMKAVLKALNKLQSHEIEAAVRDLRWTAGEF